MKRTAKSLVDEAMAQVTTYTVEQARALHGHPGVQFVDVRDVRELEHEGVIPGALHAPRGMLEFWVDPDSPYHRDVFAQDKEYVLFCALGWRSALATKTLMDMGLERVAHVEGGFTAWKDAGAPVEAKKPKAGPVARKPATPSV
jgi:rhodanese-related sulfurtransferase